MFGGNIPLIVIVDTNDTASITATASITVDALIEFGDTHSVSDDWFI